MPNIEKIKLLEKVEFSEKLYSLKFEKPFEYKAGQFMAVFVADKVKRYYSIASGPYEENLELLVNTDPGGPGSTFFESIKEGDEVEIMGPLGAFTFKSTGDVTFICTGTGIAPCIAMIKEQLHGGYKAKMHLLFGTRYEKDVLKEADLVELAEKYPNFSFNLSVTRPTEDWTVVDSGQMMKSKGRVTEHIGSLDIGADFYICGVKDMLEGVKIELSERGVTKDRIFFEQY